MNAALSTTKFQDHSKRTIRSIPVKAVSDEVLGLYTQIAETAPTSFPPVQAEPLSGLSGELGLLGEKNEFYPQLDNLIKREAGPGSKSRPLPQPSPHTLERAHAHGVRRSISLL